MGAGGDRTGFDIEAVLPGYTLMPGGGGADRIAHELVDRDGRLFGLVRSYADPALLYVVAVEHGRAGAPAVIAGHHWFRERDGSLWPAPDLEPESGRGRRRWRLLGLFRRR